ncbi:MAG TPA: helix-turn-helix transcriptional regulator [Candidatus Hydrogenedentes bacterium]|nr:helix-turn-helix transcriptional regulator [Candidatus Hydrogenedentota bacterium]
MDLGERLKALRTAKGYTVADLSALTGVSKPYIWQIEDSRRRNPSGEKLVRLASALGTTVADLMGAPAGIEEEVLESVPDSLRDFVRRRGKVLGVRREDVEMLKHVHYRGKRPDRVEDWELIFLFIRRILG